MEKNELLDTGILETYVLGIGTEDERILVEQMSVKFPEIQIEKEEIEALLELLAMAYAVIPASQAEIKRKIESQLFLSQKLAKETIVVPMKSDAGTNSWISWKWYSIAASILMLVAFGYAFQVRNQMNAVHNDMVAMQLESTQLQEINKKLAVESNQFSKLTNTMGQEGTRQVILTSTIQQPSKAIVFWNPANHKVWLVNTNLPALPEDKQYQLWGIVGGKPVDAGVFDAKKGNEMFAVELKSIEQPQLFAVTVENRGGVASPTMSTLCLKAEI